MVVLDEGLNKIRDLLSTNLTKGQNGTGTGTADNEDTGLETEVGETFLTLTKSKSDKIVTTTHSLSTAVGNGNNFTEFENQFSSGESLIRIRHTAISKTDTKQIEFIITYEIEGA